MKKIASIFLLFCLLTPVFCSFAYIKVQTYLTRKEIKWCLINQSEMSELVLLTFKTSEVDSLVLWEHSREFEYQHEMYDVVKKQIEGDSVKYWCWWDHEETALNRKLRHLVKLSVSGNPENKERSTELYRLFESIYFLPEVSSSIKTFFLQVSGIEIKLPEYRPYHIHPPSPPPEPLFFFMRVSC